MKTFLFNYLFKLFLNVHIVFVEPNLHPNTCAIVPEIWSKLKNIKRFYPINHNLIEKNIF